MLASEHSCRVLLLFTRARTTYCTMILFAVPVRNNAVPNSLAITKYKELPFGGLASEDGYIDTPKKKTQDESNISRIHADWLLGEHKRRCPSYTRVILHYGSSGAPVYVGGVEERVTVDSRIV